ncbi:ABC transporter permease [Nakamurella aerolata]|uniref:ABC transporter permease n=1 Tax=Nakamurella aerolata TaxID=1656892 RepID=A0A849A5K8_9ACTN|nr:ABC transporter permease [Nakamurella aerolata]NNG35347.1 ABC transporter permease [Nakamurella aerolata]
MTSAEVPVASGGMSDSVRLRLQQLGAFAGLIIIVIFFAIVSDNFFSYDNLVNNVLVSVVLVGILALGGTFVIITGGIDLSVGFGMGVMGMIAGRTLISMNLPLWLGILLTLLAGALIGFINGFNISILGMPPFIATLAMMLICQGLRIVLSDGGASIYFDKLPAFQDIANGELIPKVPNQVLVFIGAAIIAWILLNRTLLGRYTYAIGSNEAATALSGINTRKWKIIVYTVAGVFTGLAGIVSAARLGASPAAGTGYELQAIAAVVIGGTSLAGGSGTIVGTVIGALIIGVLNNGLQTMSVPQQWQYVILGVVILIAVYIDMLRKRSTSTLG